MNAHLLISTYDGVLCGYELVPDQSGLKFVQEINSQEGKQPLKSLVTIGANLFVANANNICKYDLRTHKQLAVIELKDRADILFAFDKKLLAVHNNLIDIFDAATGDNLQTYKARADAIQSICAYNKTSFCVLAKNILIAFMLNSCEPLATLKLPADFFQVHFVNDHDCLLLNSDVLVKHNIQTNKTAAEFKNPNMYCFFAAKEFALVGTALGELIVLDLDLKKLKKVKAGEGRLKRIAQVEEDVFCAIFSDGGIVVFGYDRESNEVLEVGAHKIVKRPIDVAAFVPQEEALDEGEEGGEELWAEELDEFDVKE